MPSDSSQAHTWPVSVQTKIVLGALCVFNGITLAILGCLSVLFVDGRSAPVLALAFWSAASVLFLLSRRLSRGPEWE
jgi:hypothetical protein